jgi:hypothetical protein
MPVEYIYKWCEVCKGTGKVISPSSLDTPGGSPDCKVCSGLGKVLWGYLQDELEGGE